MSAHLDRAREMAECAAARVEFNDREREQWRPIVNFEGRYEISSLGRVRRVEHRQGGKLLAARMMTARTLNTGYRFVSVSSLGKRTYLFIHRQMLLAFEGPPPGDRIFACHNNGVKTDNRLSNLRWDTRLANAADAKKHGQAPYARRTHCIHGHEFNAENTIVRAEGHRACRACKTRRNLEATERRRADRVDCADCGLTVQRCNFPSHMGTHTDPTSDWRVS